jgi:NAD(P)H-quinone oxidoreductase subunit 5
MTGQQQATVGEQLPDSTSERSRIPKLLTRVVWLLWIASGGALVAHLRSGENWAIEGLINVDGLTVVMWVTVTFFSGIVHSYSRRYMAGSRTVDRFFTRVFAFTLMVMSLVAADNLVLFGTVWLLMGLVMADLIGHVQGWPQAQAAGSLARRYFLASSALLATALVTLWWDTGATTITELAATVGTASSTGVLFAASILLLAAMVQSALVPFHTWLLSSMTAPTPASALMHAGFVNAGGILLVRFAPVVTVDPGFMSIVVLVGAASALGGKFLKTVRVDIKSKLGCSTVGQMGFMIMQVGLGFFGAAITHLILHGFYKAYHFLASGSQIAHKSPTASGSAGRTSIVGTLIIAVTALAGGGLFAALTGKGTALDSGLLLMLLVVLMVLHAAREIVDASLPTAIRYGAVPLVALPAIGVYAAILRAIEGLLAGLPALGQPVALTPIHGLVAVSFLVAYVTIESGVYKRSHRLYVALLNMGTPPSETLLTSTEDYNEY